MRAGSLDRKALEGKCERGEGAAGARHRLRWDMWDRIWEQSLINGFSLDGTRH